MVRGWKVECVHEHRDETVIVGVVYVSLREAVSKLAGHLPVCD